MRSSLFETLVIGELLKSRYNPGLVSNLYFWRDNTGNEVDVLIENADKLLQLEIKSGSTITKDYFTGIKKWFGIADSEAYNPHIIYGGTESHIRS